MHRAARRVGAAKGGGAQQALLRGRLDLVARREEARLHRLWQLVAHGTEESAGARGALSSLGCVVAGSDAPSSASGAHVDQ